MTKLLKNVQHSAQTEDYAGIITHNNGKETQSMYLVHIVDGKGERERLVLLDGVEREFLRENEITQCLLPNEEIVIQEPSRTDRLDRKSTRLNSSHVASSYAVFCLK